VNSGSENPEPAPPEIDAGGDAVPPTVSPLPIPQGSARRVPKAEVQSKLSGANPTEVKNEEELNRRSSDFEPPSEVDAGSASLIGFVRMRPFVGLYFAIADRVGDEKMTPRRRCSAMKDAHPKFFWLCATADFLLTLACMIIVVYIATRVAIKAIS